MEGYIKRHAEITVNKLSKMFGAVLVAGRLHHDSTRKRLRVQIICRAAL